MSLHKKRDLGSSVASMLLSKLMLEDPADSWVWKSVKLFILIGEMGKETMSKSRTPPMTRVQFPFRMLAGEEREQTATISEQYVFRP